MSKGLRRSLKRSKFAGTTIPHTIPVDVEIAITDGNPGVGTAVIRGLPKGNILLFGAVAYLTFTDVDTATEGLIAAFAGDYSMGSTADANGVLSAGDVDIIASTAILAASSVTPKTRGTTGATAFGVPILLDNTDESLEINLNLLIDDASIDDAATVRAVGALHIAYVVLGDDDDA